MHVRIGRFTVRAPHVAVIVLAALTALTVHAVLSAAEASRRSWGESVAVLVTKHSIAAGSAIGNDDIEARRFPRATVADGALETLPANAMAAVPLARGDVIVRARLADQGFVPAGMRAITVALTDARPPLRDGDRADLVATFAPDQPAVVVARDALVVDVAEDGATFAVPIANEEAVAVAARQGQVVVAISARPSPPG